MTEPLPPPEADVDWLVGVLGHAAGCSAAQFVPVPFLDDWAVSVLFTRIAEKVLSRHAGPSESGYAKQIAKGYLDEGGSSIGTWVLVTAAKFVLRKIAIVFDVKKSHDVFGEAIAFALALDVALEQKTLLRASPRALGATIFRAVRAVGRGPLGALASAAAAAWASAKNAKGEPAGGEGDGAPSPKGGVSAVGGAIKDSVAAEAKLARAELARAFAQAANAPPT